jgi:hypothetical protein
MSPLPPLRYLRLLPPFCYQAQRCKVLSIDIHIMIIILAIETICANRVCISVYYDNTGVVNLTFAACSKIGGATSSSRIIPQKHLRDLSEPPTSNNRNGNFGPRNQILALEMVVRVHTHLCINHDRIAHVTSKSTTLPPYTNATACPSCPYIAPSHTTSTVSY